MRFVLCGDLVYFISLFFVVQSLYILFIALTLLFYNWHEIKIVIAMRQSDVDMDLDMDTLKLNTSDNKNANKSSCSTYVNVCMYVCMFEMNGYQCAVVVQL